MKFFTYFTPVSYWILIFLWSFIFIFYLRRIVRKTLESKLFITLLSILAIDAFRTVIESLYFGAWYTSLVGFLPKLSMIFWFVRNLSSYRKSLMSRRLSLLFSSYLNAGYRKRLPRGNGLPSIRKH